MEMLALIVIALIVSYWEWVLAIAAIIGIIYAIVRCTDSARQHNREVKAQREREQRERKLAEDQRQRTLVSEQINEFQIMKYGDTHLFPFLRTLETVGTKTDTYRQFLNAYSRRQNEYHAESVRLNEKASELGIPARIQYTSHGA